MVASSSDTKVCNATLAYLGESRRIQAMDDGTPLARMFEQVWDETVEEVLAAHPWNPALARAQLAVSADAVLQGSQYAQAFAKPADLLRWLPWRKGHDDYFDGEEEGDFILSNAEAPITIRYIRRLTIVAKWSPGMRAALSAKLAWKLAKPITGQTGTTDRMKTNYTDEVLPDAKRQDGAATGERARYLQPQSNWIAARNRPSRGGCGG